MDKLDTTETKILELLLISKMKENSGIWDYELMKILEKEGIIIAELKLYKVILRMINYNYIHKKMDKYIKPSLPQDDDNRTHWGERTRYYLSDKGESYLLELD